MRLSHFLVLSMPIVAQGHFGYEPLVESLINIEKQSVIYQPNPLYSACTCDLTTSSCDAYCCCDNDCSSDLRKEWKSQSDCSDVNYDLLRGAPLNKCVKDY
jgi:hypothetical protein